MYVLYIARAADRFGVARTREIFEKAIAALPDAGALGECVALSLCVQIFRVHFRYSIGTTIRRDGSAIGRDRSRARSLHARVAARRSAPLPAVLEEVARVRGAFVRVLMRSHRLVAVRAQVQFGNEDTFAEMLRVKRSVQTAHTTTINVAAVEMATTGTSEVDDIGQGASDFLVQVEREAELVRAQRCVRTRAFTISCAGA
jgi:pre-mRNA-splicing factor SYF1